MTPAECNYKIYHKELLAIVPSFEQWRQYLEPGPEPVLVYCDHKYLKYFMSTKLLNRRQARWAQTLSQLKFVITDRPGPRNEKPDALTHRSGDLPKSIDQRLTQQQQTILKPENLHLQALSAGAPRETSLFRLFATTVTHDSTHFPALRLAWPKDPLCAQLMKDLAEKKSHSRFLRIAECKVVEGLLHYQGLLYVPNDTKIKLQTLRSCHDAPFAGHPGPS